MWRHKIIKFVKLRDFWGYYERIIFKIPTCQKSAFQNGLWYISLVMLWWLHTNPSKFHISRQPWNEHDFEDKEGMRVNFFAKTKTKIGNWPLIRWKTIEIFNIVRSQSLNFTSKPKGYLLQTTKLWKKLFVLYRTKEKSGKDERRSKIFKLEKGKVC